MNSNSRIISTDEDPSLRIESSAIINLRGVSTKLNKYNNYIVSLFTADTFLARVVQTAQSGLLLSLDRMSAVGFSGYN